jgi:Tol biopolymer transport system component
MGGTASLPSLSRQGSRLAFTWQSIDTNIWRLDLATAGRVSKAPVKWIASTKTDAAPQLSPDGGRIAFTSDRSGTLQVWVCNVDGSSAFPLTSFPGSGAGLGTWSPDGRSIAFGAGLRGNPDIYVISAQGGTARQLTAEISREAGPSWSRDGRWIYFWSDRTGRAEIWKVLPAGGPAVQVTRKGGCQPLESTDGKFVYYTKTVTNFDAWRVPVEGGEETPVLEGLRSRWAVAEGGLYLFEQDHDRRWFLKYFDFSSGRKKALAVLGGVPVVSKCPAVSRDGRTAFYEQWDGGQADLVLVDGFR